MINRRTVKRHVAAVRSLLQVIRVHDIEISDTRGCEAWIEALERVRTSTEALARETFQPREQQP